MINGLYSYESVREQMHKHFKANNHILINEFLSKELYSKLKDFKKIRKIYRADRNSFEEVEIPDALENFLQSSEFISFVKEVSGEKFSEIEISAKKFGHKDYTLINDDEMPEKGLQFVFFICDKWQKEWGGSSIYTYGDGEPLIFSPKGNSLILIKNDGKLFDFTKYVNHFAGKNELVKIEGRVR